MTRIVTDPDFAGEDGMIKVWNQTPGFVQVTDEGHLLAYAESAWVEDNDSLRGLILDESVVVLSGFTVDKSQAKKNTKTPAAETSPSGSDTSPNPPAAQAPSVVDNKADSAESFKSSSNKSVNSSDVPVDGK